MRNTGTDYLSTERTPMALPEMAELLPPLSDEQLSVLEADLLQNGCYSPVIVNEDLVIVDGHHRHELCERHGLPYRMAVFAFEDLLEAKQWALDTQKSRRNLSAWELGQIALKLKPDIEAKASANQGTRTDLSAILPEGYQPTDTRKELANAVGLAERTMGKIMKIDEHAPDSVKEAVNDGSISISKGYEITKQLEEVSDDEREAAALERINAEKEQRKGKKAVDDNTRTAKQYCAAFEAAALLEADESSVRIWIEWAGVRKDEISDMIVEAEEAAKKFSQIAGILREIYEKEVAPYESGEEYGEEESIEAEDTEQG